MTLKLKPQQEVKRKMMTEKPSTSKSRKPISISKKRSRKAEWNYSVSDNYDDTQLATKRMVGRATTSAPGTSSMEDECTTTDIRRRKKTGQR